MCKKSDHRQKGLHQIAEKGRTYELVLIQEALEKLSRLYPSKFVEEAGSSPTRRQKISSSFRRGCAKDDCSDK